MRKGKRLKHCSSTPNGRSDYLEVDFRNDEVGVRTSNRCLPRRSCSLPGERSEANRRKVLASDSRLAFSGPGLLATAPEKLLTQGQRRAIFSELLARRLRRRSNRRRANSNPEKIAGSRGAIKGDSARANGIGRCGSSVGREVKSNQSTGAASCRQESQPFPGEAGISRSTNFFRQSVKTGAFYAAFIT